MRSESDRPRILIVEDDTTLADLVSTLLQDEGFDAEVRNDGADGARAAAEGNFDLVITDYRLPGKGGMELLEEVHESNPRLPVIMMTSFGTSETMIGAAKRGVFEYLVKPFEMDDLIEAANKAIRSSRLMFRPVEIGNEEKEGGIPIIGACPAMQEVFKEIGRVAPTNASVLIRGETGTGKELVARAIYQHSERAKEPFVAVNCGAIPETLLESELFGHRKGAFTGADMNRIGRLEQADGGTLFLDEIGDMPIATQVKLLRALQEKTIQPLGSSDEVDVDVRVLAATHQDLEARIASGQFREDLFYRLNMVVIHVPPLRERGGDIEELAKYFLLSAAREFSVEAAQFSTHVVRRLAQHDWLGNVRQLENVVARAVLQARGRVLSVEDMEGILQQSGSPRRNGSDVGESLDSFRYRIREALKEARDAGRGSVHANFIAEVEKLMITEALRLSGNRLIRCAEWLGISRVTLRQRIDGLGLNANDQSAQEIRNKEKE